jgi:hypothetical protein
LRARSSQRRSITASFSAVVISFNGKTISIFLFPKKTLRQTAHNTSTDLFDYIAAKCLGEASPRQRTSV